MALSASAQTQNVPRSSSPEQDDFQQEELSPSRKRRTLPRKLSVSSRRRGTQVLVSTPEELDDPDFGGRAISSLASSRRDSWLGSWSSIVGRTIREASASVLGGPNDQEQEQYLVDGDGQNSAATPGTTSAHAPFWGRDSPQTYSYAQSVASTGGVPIEDEAYDQSTADGERRPLLPKPVEVIEPVSSAVHTTINCINVLMGMGILSLPFALSRTGFVLGLILLIVFPIISGTSAKLLTRCMDVTNIELPSLNHIQRPKPMSYSDVGLISFGLKGKNFISAIYLMELFIACTALVILTGDSVLELFPDWNLIHVKLIAGLIIVPTTWSRNLRVLSYASIIGVASILCVLAMVIVNGLVTNETPGSVRHPADTSLWPMSVQSAAMAMGIIFVGFDGHAVFPSIYRDMATPRRFSKSVNVTYSVVTCIYVSLAICGYLMFGSAVLPEITQSLATLPARYPIFTKITLVLVALNPLTKFALASRPISASIERKLHVNTSALYAIRTLLTFSIVGVAILFPHFHRLMSFLGSAFSSIIVIIFPLSCYARFFGGSLTATQWIGILLGLVFGVSVMAFGLWGAFA
ncbi:transmembrane amino acid transporter protein-domain-containing protein [Phlyctochytrium arcticum]|nr:transmembrane amino acid transporter protein-domain-containing protein [Phlyctochytrium arcticum]